MNFAKEIQIEIDDVYACPGRCPGCALSNAEKKAVSPDMSDATRKNIYHFLNEYIKNFKEVEKINLTYGIADHFLMDIDYLKKIYIEGAIFLEKHNPLKQNSLFLTLSLIGKESHILEKLDMLASIQKEYPIKMLPIVVLDPIKLYHDKFGKIYEKSIAYAKSLFEEVDLAINLSIEAVEKMSAQDLFSFAKAHNFSEVTINWVPTEDNLSYTFNEQFKPKLIKWLIDFSNLIESDNTLSCSYVPVIKKSLDAAYCAADAHSLQEANMSKSIDFLVPETTLKSIQFDHLGNVFPKLEAIGDIAHNERFGFKTWGNINHFLLKENFKITEQKALTFLSDKLNQTKRQIFKQFNNKNCINCEYNTVCATSGFHVYNNIIKNDHENCPHIAYDLLKHFDKDHNLWNKS
jgi:hypothetical protein